MKQRIVQLYIFTAMFVYSMTTNSVAPLLLDIQEQYGISIAVSSIVPLLKTVSVIGANIIGSMFIAQAGIRNTINSAILLGIFGSILFAVGHSFWVICIAGVFIGAGTGITFMGLSTLNSHLEKQYQNFGLFHAFFGLGGITSPLMVSFIQRYGIHYRYMYVFFSLVLAALFIFSFLTHYVSNIKYQRIRFREAGRILSKPVVYLTFAVFFLYSGSEIGIITWNGNLFHGGFGTSKGYASLMLSIFWGVFTFGRVITQNIERRIGPHNLLRFSPYLVLISVPLLVFTHWPIFLFTAAVGLAPIFPTTQKFGNLQLPGRQAGLYNGIVFVFAASGSSIFVTLMGVIADLNIFAAYAVPFFCFIGIRVIVWGLAKAAR